MSLSFDGRVALVTGASRGIGRAIARDISAEGAIVVVNHLGQHDEASLVVDDLVARGGRAVAMEADVSDFAAVQAMVAAVQDEFGRLDFLVNNAGVYPWRAWRDVDDGLWDRVMAVNVRGPFNCAKACFPLLKACGAGRIVNIASTAPISAPRNLMAYTTSKSALIGLTRSMAREMGDDDITVNAVSSGTTVTEGLQEWVREGVLSMDDAIASRASQPIKRLGQPEDLAGAVLFLLGPRAGFITGQLINVDGGRQFY